MSLLIENLAVSISSQTISPAATSTLDVSLQKRGLTNKPRTQHDNFYTPRNDFFYENSPYLALDAKRREIRLLRVFPPNSYQEHIQDHPQWAPNEKAHGQPLHLNAVTVSSLISQYSNFRPSSQLIACEIIDKVAPSRMDGNYCVLSYCAGKPTKTKVLLVDGLPFNAFANLERAIRLALVCWASRNPGRELLLWVDQICINQSDHLERTNQVGIMREIYRRSNETFISLDISGFENCLSWARSSNNGTPGVDDSSVGGHLKFNSVAGLKNCLKNALTSQLLSPKTLDPWITSLEAFMKNPWWCRAWVYQEFTASPRPRFLAGSASIPWNELSLMVGIIYSGLEEVFASILAEISESTSRKESIRDLAVEKHKQSMMKYQMELQQYHSEPAQQKRVTLQRKEERYLRDLRTDIADIEESMGKIPIMTRLGSRYTGYKALRNELRYHKQDLTGIPGKRRTSHTTVMMRENVSSAINQLERFSVWFQDKRWDFDVSLRESVNNILQRRVEALKDIHKDGSGLMPSFSSEPTRPSEPSEIRIQNDLLKETEGQKGIIESIKNRVVRLDSPAISSLVKAKLTGRRSLDLKTHLQHSRHCEASDPRDRIYAFLNLAQKGYAIVPDYSMENTVVHAMISAARRIIEYEKTLEILEHTSRGREKLGYFMPSWVPDWTSPETDCGLRTYASSTFPDRGDAPFDAAKGLCAEAVFRIAEADESNVDLHVDGCFIDRLDELEGPIRDFPDLQLFLTPNGLRIIMSKFGLVDDEIWVLHGASTPMVLRPEGDDMYGVIGPALVCTQDRTLSDIMFGHVIDLAQQGKADTRKIWLV